MSLETNRLDLFAKIKSIQALQKQIDKTREATRALQLRDCDLTEEEQAQIPEEEQYFEFDAEMQIALRPDKPEQAPTLTASDVNRQNSFEEGGDSFDMYSYPFRSNGELWLPLQTAFPHYMVRKWKPDAESWTRLKKAFGDNPFEWREGEGPLTFGLVPLKIRVEDDEIKAYPECVNCDSQTKDDQPNPPFSS